MKKILVLSIISFLSWHEIKSQSIEQLTLDDAIRLAKQNRHAYLLAIKDATAATLSTREARAGYAPKLTLDADARYNAILATSIVPNFASSNPSEKIPIRFGTPLQSTAGVTLRQSLLNPTLKPTLEANEVREQLAETAKQKSLAELVAAVSTSYYQVLLYEAAISYGESNFIRWESLWKQLELRQKEGRALPTDVSAAFINKENARLSLQQDQQNLFLARQYLALQMGSDSLAIRNAKLTTTFSNLILEAPKPSDQINPDARAEFREARLNETLANWNAKREWKGFMPALNFVGYLGASGFGDKNNNIFNLSNSWFGSSYVGLQLSMPFLDISRSYRVETQRVNQERAIIQQNQWKNQIQFEVQQAQLKVSQALESISVKKQNLELAKQNEKITHDRFEEGRSLLTELLDSEALLQQVQQQVLQSLFDYVNAKIELDKATGVLERN